MLSSSEVEEQVTKASDTDMPQVFIASLEEKQPKNM